ncbi:hypothetical protein LT493_09970 [Streptomyces tricolor]|nr:hypothetical protein [Streptomyces tricolor]
MTGPRSPARGAQPWRRWTRGWGGVVVDRFLRSVSPTERIFRRRRDCAAVHPVPGSASQTAAPQASSRGRDPGPLRGGPMQPSRTRYYYAQCVSPRRPGTRWPSSPTATTPSGTGTSRGAPLCCSRRSSSSAEGPAPAGAVGA